jgi:hypothetical protein
MSKGRLMVVDLQGVCTVQRYQGVRADRPSDPQEEEQAVLQKVDVWQD